MPKLIVDNFITMDGYYDTLDGGLDGVFAHRWSGYTSIDDFDEYNLGLLNACPTLVLGRKTYIGSRSYWKEVGPDTPTSDVRRRLADRFRTIDKVVVGSSPEGVDLEGWGPASFVLRDQAPQAIAGLKARGDVLVMMSRLLWNELLGQRLVDEVHLTVFPMALGVGNPIFARPPTCAFRLVESRAFPASGNVLLRYEVVYE